MLARIKSCAVVGIDAAPVDVEVRIQAGGVPEFSIIGLGDGAVRESCRRVASALQSAGFELPNKILVNLAPAEMRKEGSSFDLPIALGILAASGRLKTGSCPDRSFHGELSLDGRVKGVRGALSLVLESFRSGSREVIVPAANAAESSLLHDARIIAFHSLPQLIRYLNEGVAPEQGEIPSRTSRLPLSAGFSEVRGQDSAKRALLIAAAGGHNVLMIGPPGCGKSMLAERFETLLPPLGREETLEAVRIHSIAGEEIVGLLCGKRPFRSPHHVISDVGLVGGGSVPRPGEISLAHHGVLFLDEFPEYRRTALEALRAPLEVGKVRITRAKMSVVFPARFQLIAAMNPCPCGRLGSHGRKAGQPCLCSRGAIAAYLRKLSQPILDRIDLHVELEAVPLEALTTASAGDPASDTALQERVTSARALQLDRQGKLNSLLSSQELGSFSTLDSACTKLLEQASAKTNLSARGYVRVLRVARSIADLEQTRAIKAAHIAEALAFRGLERIEAYTRG